MTDFKLQSIESTELSQRSKNALRRNGSHTIGDMMGYTEEMLYTIPQLGKKSVEEIMAMIEHYRNLPLGVTKPIENDERVAEEYLRFYAIKTDVLPLSSGAYNVLTFSGYEELRQFAFMSAEELMRIDGMNERFALEIEKECNRYLREKGSEIADFIVRMQNETEEKKLPFFEALSDEERKTVLEYVKFNDVAIQDMKIPTNAKNKCFQTNRAFMSDIIFMTKDEVKNMGGLGDGTVAEVIETIRCYREEHLERIKAYLGGDSSVLLTDEHLSALILQEFLEIKFGGLSVSELREKLEKTVPVSEDRIKKALGRLIAQGELEYVDYRCYKIYEKFSDFYLKAELTERETEVIAGRLAGKTLKEIGDSFEITRERIRQIELKALRKIGTQHELQTGTALFDEDYYAYFFEKYAFDREDGARWLGITDEICIYMDLTDHKKGDRSLEEALKDTQNLEAGLRMKIKNYLNRDKLWIDGKWVKKTRVALEPIVIRKYCTDEVTFAEFINIFNEFLKNAEIPYDEDIYYTDAILASRKNRFTESRDILWKSGEKFRYYDIDGQDYTELFETLNLGFYRDVELSAAKFMMEYPDLMGKYDIRDEYELHNLLKKVLENNLYGKFENLQFAKMPILRFGQPDRDGALLALMVDNAPISSKDLCELIHREYGYDRRMIPSYLSRLSEYQHQGIYSIDHKEMNKERMGQFNSVLDEDFYTFEELRRIYCDMFEGADKNDINSYNLKRMGFLVNSNYVVRNYPSAYKFFEARLTEADNFHIGGLRERFAVYGTYQAVLGNLKKNLEIVEYEPDRFIHFRKLEKGGMTKEMIAKFCEEVYEAAPDNDIFTIATLCRDGFESELFGFGFEDLFYSSLLTSDERFSFKKLWGTILFRKGKEDVSAKTLIVEIVKREERLDIYELNAILKEDYGCGSVYTHDIVGKVKDSDIFYDSELQIFYADEELYYREIDEAEDFD